MSQSDDMKDVPLETEEVKSPQSIEPNEAPAIGCGIMGKYPVISVLSFALVGIGAGVGLSFWEPDDMEKKDKLLKWIGLVGAMFIRALKCIVLPLVFVNVITSVVDMMTVGKAGSVGWKTIALYLCTTICACILGILSTLSIKSLYKTDAFGPVGPAYFQFECDTEGSFITEDESGALMCMAGTEDMDSSKFVVSDLGKSFIRSSSGPASDISLSDTVYEGVFEKLISSNIMEDFAKANFAAVVFFAIVFGVALSRVLETHNIASANQSIVIRFLKEVDAVLLVIINWIIMLTPFAVLSLITKAVGGQENLADAFENVGYLVLATVIAMTLQVLVVYMGLFGFLTKSNPLTYLRKIVPAQTMAFACASSAATIPVTLKSVDSTGKVPPSIARFVVPLGATVNMDGGAIYFPCACIWLAVLNGIDVNFGHYILLVIISTIGSVGTAPVPSASLVLIITAYNTVFNTTGTPDGFSFILAIDWFMDRLRTTTNVSGDAIVAGMVAHLCPLDEVPGEAGSFGTDEEHQAASEQEENNTETNA